MEFIPPIANCTHQNKTWFSCRIKIKKSFFKNAMTMEKTNKEHLIFDKIVK